MDEPTRSRAATASPAGSEEAAPVPEPSSGRSADGLLPTADLVAGQLELPQGTTEVAVDEVFSDPDGLARCRFDSVGQVFCQATQPVWAGPDAMTSADGSVSCEPGTVLELRLWTDGWLALDCGCPMTTPTVTLATGASAALGTSVCVWTGEGMSCWSARGGNSLAFSDKGLTGREDGGYIPPQEYTW